MLNRRRRLLILAILMVGAAPQGGRSDEPARGSGTAGARIVFVAGSSVSKPGEHEYVAGCKALMALVRQTPGVIPVLAVDWPRDPDAFAGASAIVLFLDGGAKHPLLRDHRLDEITALSEKGVGLVQLHQVADYPVDRGDQARHLAGAAWEQGYSKRAHWIAAFSHFPDHPITRGVTPFTVDDGWLTGLRFVPGMKGVTPLLRTSPPSKEQAKAKVPVPSPAPGSGDESIVSWAFERPDGGRSFTFTGGHLHRSLGEPGYRRFLVNGILWAAHQEIPTAGAPVVLDAAELDGFLGDRTTR